MRIAVFILGLLGTGLTALLGVSFLFGGSIQEWILRNVPGMSLNIHATILMKMGLFLLAGTLLGFLGSLMSLFRYGPQGGILMIVGISGPAILNPATLFGTGLLGLTGLLSFFVRQRPARVAAE